MSLAVPRLCTGSAYVFKSAGIFFAPSAHRLRDNVK